MNAYCRVLEARYVDSVVLMRLAQSLAHQAGVDDAAAMMGTDANKAVLREGGYLRGDVAAGANDLIIAVRSDSFEAAEVALASVDELLARPMTPTDAGSASAPTVDAAVLRQPESNLAVISLPGEYAAAEARRALELGLHVFLFSSNVPLKDELELKAMAHDRGLLCMGPDCGTSIIAGKGLGFANAVRRGSVGIVGASGTGIQVVSTLLDQFGVGVSHAIGCGSRDLTNEVGGATAIAGLDALLRDDSTQVVVLISKPAPAEVTARLRERAAKASKPVIFGFLGDPGGPPTLAEVARQAAAAVLVSAPPLPELLDERLLDERRAALVPGQRLIRGLYAGGTLAYEAQLVLRGAGFEVASNVPLPGSPLPAELRSSEQHTVVDFGAEEFTRGRPHPMIDARARCKRLLEVAEDPAIAVILLDVVLGYGAAADPAGDLSGAIVEARHTAHAAGRELVILAYVCGTHDDPQGLERQQKVLSDAGVVLLPTNSAMAQTAARLVAGIATLESGATFAATGGSP